MRTLGMCRHMFLSKGFLEIALIFIVIFMNLPTTSNAQPGFLSIDCGGTRGNYTDSLQLNWVTDNGTYIKSGRSFSMSSLPEDGGNVQALGTFRYFPEGRNKYCYKLPTTPNATYLIRASFYMNESVLSQSEYFLFVVSINANDWFSVAKGSDNSVPDLNVRQEAIFHSPKSVTYFCLHPVLGIPFISSLELRQLDPNMYQYSGSALQYLSLQSRYNVGAYYTDPPVRHPDDEYDRIWESPGISDYNDLPVMNVSTAPDQTSSNRPEVYYVPPKVMQDGWLVGPNVHITATLFWNDPQVSLPPGRTPGTYATVVLYSEHLNVSDQQVYGMNFSLDGQQSSTVWNYSTRASMVTVSNFILSSNAITLAMDLESGARVENGPTFNAVEVYSQYNFNFSTTSQDDDNAITALKESFNLTDWQGDPCTPVPHDWLACSLDSLNFQPIRQPCFSGGTGVTQCVVPEGFLRSTYYVINVSLSNLPATGFDLLRVSSLNVSLTSLTSMSITSSGVDGQTFEFLLNEFSEGQKLTVLDFSNNSIDRIPNWADVSNLVDVNLAHNILTDLSSQDLPLNVTLQNLKLSYNAIASLPSAWQTTANDLVVLDLSHNKLQDEISSLDRMVQMNSGSLKELSVSDNNLHGTFNSTVYFTRLSNLTTANFAQNGIGGTLDLSIWYQALKNASDSASGGVKAAAPPGRYQLFSFMNNNISSIVPNAEAFDANMEQLLETIQYSQQYGGILLGGNPYCVGASSYVHRYLCRYAITETIQPDNKKKSKTVLILSIVGGILTLIIVLAVLATLWNLWKQVFSLRQVQKALAARKVQPPFFQYSDLKVATRDFHKDNKLGHGSFGVVHKGVLGDQTLIAVKKLFISQRLQVLDEFLNEVVLITGIKHRNLVQLKGCCIKDKQRILVVEYVEKGNLAEALWGSKAHGGLNWEQRYEVCVGIARGLAYLHEELQPSIIHRDIKPANILLDKNFKPKIADFGLARHYSDDTNQSQYTQIAGTLGYFAPEYAMHGQLSNKADVYSYGIVILEIVSGRKCIDSTLPQDEKFLKNWACALIKKGLVLDVLDSELRDCCVPEEVIRVMNIALLCVQHYPERRPSMSQVVTLLSGSVKVEGFQIGESKTTQSNFEDLLVTINSDIDYPALQRLAEDSTMYPVLSLDSQLSTTSNYTAGTTSRSREPSIELSSVHGR